MAIKSKNFKILRIICFLLSLICLGTSVFSVCRILNFSTSAGYFYGLDNFRKTLYEPKMSTDFLYEMGLTYYSIRRAFITYDDGKIFDSETFEKHLDGIIEKNKKRYIKEHAEQYQGYADEYNKWFYGNNEGIYWLEGYGQLGPGDRIEENSYFLRNEDGRVGVNYEAIERDAESDLANEYDLTAYKNEHKYLKAYISQLSGVEYFLVNNKTGKTFTNSSFETAAQFCKAYEDSGWFVSSDDNFETVTVGSEFKNLSDMTKQYSPYRYMAEDGDIAQTTDGIVLNNTPYLYEFFTAIRYGYQHYMSGNSYIVGPTNIFEPDPCTVYLSFDYSRVTAEDPFKDIFTNYNQAVDNLERDAVIGAVCLVLWLILGICLLKVTSKEELNLTWQNKIPGEIHFLICGGLAFGCGALAVGCVYMGLEYDRYYLSEIVSRFWHIGCVACTLLCYSFIINWLITLIQGIKGKVYFNRLLVVMPFRLCKKIAKRLAANSSNMKTGVRRIFKIAIPVYLAISVLCWLLLSAADSYNGGIIFLCWLVLIITNAALGIILYYYAKALDKIRETVALSAKGDFDVELSCASMPKPMVDLAKDIGDMRSGMELAINNAIRDQKTKTELITNVSHDLKTPLTSIITYSDLITRSDIGDETVKSYAQVLTEKSYRLKQLIEDLTEASKVSTGNVDLQLAEVSLYELAMQAVGENTESLEKAGVDLRFTELTDKPTVRADGQKTYRIFENIISNISKYSMPGTRAYVTLAEENGYGVITFKNISNEPLNIPADQLMERFVRGDAARTGEGSGLGLSIARDLCELQGGKFEIRIDGDLFTATVELPLVQQ